MKLYELIFTENACYKAGRKIKPKGVMWHSTGANNPNLKRYVGPDDGLLGHNANGNHWNREMSRQVCVHAFIGKLKDGTIATYQVLPWDHRGWHSGGAANNTHIGFEICEDGLTDKAYFDKAYKEAVELTAYLCKLYGFDPMEDGVIIDHSEGAKRGIASNHGDVAHWFSKHGKSMDTARADVKAVMNGGTISATTETKKEVCDVEVKVLRMGDKGSAVKALQLLLYGNHCSCGVAGADGDFGNGTLAGVKKYQKDKGLTVDGVVGAQTWGSLLK